MRRFIPNLAELRDMTNMLKKDAEVKWDKETRESFQRIKEALKEAPVLISPDYLKPFQIFSFVSSATIAVVLLQRNEEKYEQPIAYFSKVLWDAELKYNILEKQVYALVKA